MSREHVIHAKRENRQTVVQRRCGVDCSCHLCLLPPEESQKKDDRVTEVFRLYNLIGKSRLLGALRSPLQTLR